MPRYRQTPFPMDWEPTHTVPLCGEATAYGEGCPIDKCRCKCHAWISVNEEWPEDGEPVLIFSEGVGVEPAYQQGGKAFYLLIAPEDQMIRALPSHWMPYPKGPVSA